MAGIAEIQHYSHKHQLKRVCNQSPFTCNGCKELGIGSCYQCKHNCDFYLHEECALIASNYITHPFFQNCHFIFDDASQSGSAATRLVCVACGKNVQGFMYRSSTNKPHIVIHPCCLKLPHNRVHDHGETLNLREMLSDTSKKCQFCGSRKISKETRGWAYVSNCGKYRYHVACAQDMIFKDCWNNVRALQTTGNKSKLRLLAQQLGLTGRNIRRYSWKIIKLIITVIFATLTGDFTSIAHALHTSLFH